ncbi:LysR family transcriptional regulator [Herbaspirillum sp. GCM10030257]|uniref:LysR family transcriptional regulator n=1 Tax=Herbaspirillum sp. GCM10030257 TaxID=3273393 RepID=UPI003623C285
MFPQLNFGQLRTFVAAAEQTSFVGASKTVNRSPAAISKQIQNLEETLGKELFTRDTRRVYLTSYGERLLPYARQILQLERDAVSAVLSDEVTGKVVFGAPDEFVSSLLGPALERFAQMYTQVDFELVCAESTALAPMLDSGSVDLAFVTRDKNLQGTFVRREAMVWVGCERTPVWKKTPLPVALNEDGCVGRNHTLIALKKSKISYRAAYSSPSITGILAMIHAGLAIAAVPDCSVSGELIRLGEAENLPVIKPIDLVLVKGANGNSQAADYLANEIISSLGK